jgi:catechol 2,3-dioxygenase
MPASTRYEICVAGHLDPRWSETFAGFTVAPQPTGETVIAGSIRDQTQLHGLLNTLFSLNVGLIGVQRADPSSAKAAIAEGEAKRSPQIGHVHLRVSDLDRAVHFYRDVLAFHVTGYGPDIGIPAAFLAAGDYHHHIGLNTFHSLGGSPPPEGHTGLHHVAILYPSYKTFRAAVQRVADHDWPIDSSEDHGATLSIYLRDPDGNGIELYYDRPRDHWFDDQGRPVIKAEPFDWRDLLSEDVA